MTSLNIKRKLVRILMNTTFHLRGFEFRVAVTPEELDLVYQNRYEIFFDEGYIGKQKNGKFIDKYDEYSLNFLALKDHCVVGTMRIILHSPYDFPTKNLFNIESSIPNEKCAEVGRFMVRKEFRGKSRLPSIGLVKLAHQSAKEAGIKYLYVNMPERLMLSFSRFGLQFEKLEELPLIEKNKLARKLIAGYFEKKTLHPYIIDIEKSEKTFIL